MPQLPLDYHHDFLLDELKAKALRQGMEQNQAKDPCSALQTSKEIQNLLSQAEYKRRALFTPESIEASFGTIKQIYNTGWFGRLLAAMLKYFGFNPHK